MPREGMVNNRCLLIPALAHHNKNGVKRPRFLPSACKMRNFSIPIPHHITWAVSAFMIRLRRIDEAMASKLDHSHRNTLTQPSQSVAVEPRGEPFQQMPVPWTFLTSGYFIGFLIFVRSIPFRHRVEFNSVTVIGPRIEQDTRDSQSTTAWTTST